MTSARGPEALALWPVPVFTAVYPDAANDHPEILRAFAAMRRLDAAAPAGGAFYASPDHLLQRCALAELHRLFEFVAHTLGNALADLNRAAWQAAGIERARIEFVGSWFQICNRGAFHDVHTHGNASWSGAYYVDVDPHARRTAHAVYGARNGVLRLYGPRFDALGGAHIDAGNAYLLDAHHDVPPEPGLLILFPSWLKHGVLPYEGERDRVVISFNAQVTAAGTERLGAFAHA